VLICTYVENGRDCDGRLTRIGVLSCPLDRLTTQTIAGDTTAPAYLPAWEPVSSRQRDEYAEAMNY